MLFIVLFEDNPDAPADIRQRLMSTHQDFQEASGAIREAGPLTDPDGGAAGGMWVVEADSFEAVEGLVKADPFWPTGLRKSYRIMRWNRLLANGKRVKPA